MKERNNNQPEQVSLPPAWCSVLCRNAMNEVCVESCAQKRDGSGFEEKPGLKLIDMPAFPDASKMTRQERFTAITVYLSKVVEHLQGVPDEHITVRRSDFDNPRGSQVSKAIPLQNVLSGISQTITVFQSGEESSRETE